jgi:hypothetical protein
LRSGRGRKGSLYDTMTPQTEAWARHVEFKTNNNATLSSTISRSCRASMVLQTEAERVSQLERVTSTVCKRTGM